MASITLPKVQFRYFHGSYCIFDTASYEELASIWFTDIFS